MRMKSFIENRRCNIKVGFFAFFGMWVLLLPAWSSGFEDCFNYQYIRQDTKEHPHGWEEMKVFKSSKAQRDLSKRWTTVNLKLTPAQEKARFGATGLEMFQKSYLKFHFDGTNMRMFVYLRVVRAAGERRLLGWRPELNPAMPKEYLDPAYPEHKKEGFDWKMLIHWVSPPDIRGSGVLIYSYNDKEKDQDTWVWFPSLRKTRRLTPSNGDDSVGGSYKTFANAFLRRITDEVPQIIGETRINGFLPFDYLDSLYVIDKYGPASDEYAAFIKKLAQPRECWVVRSLSVKGGYCDYYHTRVWVVDKEWAFPYLEEMYNSKGRLKTSIWWAWRRASGYDGSVTSGWYNFCEDMNLEEDGFSWWAAPQSNQGYDNPESWFTLRELKRSIPTINIPSMAVLPPPNLLPPEVLWPAKELQAANKKFFPERTTTFPGAELPVGLEKW